MPIVKLKMQSLLARGRAFLTPSGSSANLNLNANGFTTVKVDAALFPKPDPRIDGETCLQDCSTCTVQYPNKWSIDEDDKLYGHVKGWDTHLIVGTGKTDWVRDVTDEKGSVMEAVGTFGQEYQRSEGRGKAKLMLSASNMPTGGTHGDCDMDEGSDCLLLPSWQFIEKVQPYEVEDLMKEVVARSITNQTLLRDSQRRRSDAGISPDYNNPASLIHAQPRITNGLATTTAAPSQTTEPPSTTGSSTPESDVNANADADADADEPPSLDTLTLSPSRSILPPSKFLTRTRPIPHSALILMCSHKTRDARCGQSAPLLRKELERHLRPLSLYRDLHDDRPGGVGIYFINHVGGHKYSANVMIYRRRGTMAATAQQHGLDADGDTMYGEAVQGIWLARVRPEDCENIVRYTVLQGKVVKPERQLRGGFDREKGLVSW